VGLRGATTNTKLRALEGKWVELTVAASTWSAKQVSAAQADAFWDEHKPQPVALPKLDLTVQDLTDIEDVVVESKDRSLRDLDQGRGRDLRRQGRPLLGDGEHEGDPPAQGVRGAGILLRPIHA
jgi:hypothetical protein